MIKRIRRVSRWWRKLTYTTTDAAPPPPLPLGDFMAGDWDSNDFNTGA